MYIVYTCHVSTMYNNMFTRPTRKNVDVDVLDGLVNRIKCAKTEF